MDKASLTAFKLVVLPIFDPLIRHWLLGVIEPLSNTLWIVNPWPNAATM